MTREDIGSDERWTLPQLCKAGPVHISAPIMLSSEARSMPDRRCSSYYPPYQSTTSSFPGSSTTARRLPQTLPSCR